MARFSRLMTVDDVAELLAVNADTVRRQIREGRLGHLNIGSALRPIYRVTESALAEYLAAYEVQAVTVLVRRARGKKAA